MLDEPEVDFGHIWYCPCGCETRVLVVSAPDEQGYVEAVIQDA